MATSELPGRHVFRLGPDGTPEVVADEFEQPNGTIFSPDERTLYISDISAADGKEGRHEVRAFDVVDRRRLAHLRLFARVETDVPDGLEVDVAGQVLAAIDRDAMIWSSDGALLGHIATPATRGNLVLGGSDGQRHFLCCGASIHAVETMTRGAAWG